MLPRSARYGRRPGRSSPSACRTRWPAFVEAAVLQGRKHGFVEARDAGEICVPLVHLGAVVRQQACLCMGAGDPRRPTPKQRIEIAPADTPTEDELRQRQRAAASAPAQADGAPAVRPRRSSRRPWTKVDAATSRGGRVPRGVPRSQPFPFAVKACDIAGIDMMVAEPDAQQEYRPSSNGWHRTAGA